MVVLTAQQRMEALIRGDAEPFVLTLKLKALVHSTGLNVLFFSYFFEQGILLVFYDEIK